MRLTSDIVLRAESYTNAIKERELNLRGFKIPLIENLAVLQDQVDIIDFSDNDLKIVENFPKMSKLNCLLLMSNSISRISGNSSLFTNLSNVTSIILSNNNISQLTEVYNLSGFKKLEILSLLENPVSLNPHYRKYVILKIPSLKILDFLKVKQNERTDAVQWSKSQEGRAFIAQIQADAITKNAASGVAGTGMAGSASISAASPSLVTKVVAAPVKRVYSEAEKTQIRAAIESASSPEAMDLIEKQLKNGTFVFSNGAPVPATTSEAEAGVGSKRKLEEAEDANENAKAVRAE